MLNPMYKIKSSDPINDFCLLSHKSFLGIESVCASTPNFIIPISVQPDSVNLRNTKFRLFDLTEFMVLIAKVYDDIMLQRNED